MSKLTSVAVLGHRHTQKSKTIAALQSLSHACILANSKEGSLATITMRIREGVNAIDIKPKGFDCKLCDSTDGFVYVIHGP